MKKGPLCNVALFFLIEMKLDETIKAIGDGLVHIDATRVRFRAFQPGVGPYGEPQLVKLLAAYLNELPKFRGAVLTKRTPDLLIQSSAPLPWKRQYDWRLLQAGEPAMRKAQGGGRHRVEHKPAKIDLTRLVESFEAIAMRVTHIDLSTRVEYQREGLRRVTNITRDPPSRRLRCREWTFNAPSSSLLSRGNGFQSFATRRGHACCWTWCSIIASRGNIGCMNSSSCPTTFTLC